MHGFNKDGMKLFILRVEDEDKILKDHEKLVQLCIDEISKKCVKEALQKKYDSFGVNIASDEIIVHGLIHNKGVKYYIPITKAKIPLRTESVKEVEDFVHVLMTIWGVFL